MGQPTLFYFFIWRKKRIKGRKCMEEGKMMIKVGMVSFLLFRTKTIKFTTFS